jgi:hypothetical protein
MALFKTPSVDAIMSAFVKAVDSLEKLAEDKLIEAERQTDIITQAVTRKKEAQAEADKAIKVSEKLTKLISE